MTSGHETGVSGCRSWPRVLRAEGDSIIDYNSTVVNFALSVDVKLSSRVTTGRKPSSPKSNMQVSPKQMLQEEVNQSEWNSAADSTQPSVI
ncbi:uncharacterized protein V6R79_002807 [Siganus canaliculatus]